MKILHPFSLVGGTALSLRYGHRTSIDLDLFYHERFDPVSIVSALKSEFGVDYSAESKTARWGIFCYIEGIKVDIIYHPHPLISKIEECDGIRMYHDADIVAMKIKAILGSGKKKDFWDLAELLKKYDLEKVINFYLEKYPDQILMITVPQAITYFDEADSDLDPISLKGQTWQSIKSFIQKKVSDYMS